MTTQLEQSPPVTLYREIDALGGVIDPNDAEARGRMEMLDTVLEILERRGFTEYADAGDWQPIETALKDGTAVDLWIGGCREPDAQFGRPQHSCGEAGRYCDCCPSYDGWVSSYCNYYLDGDEGLYSEGPTHWQPLPTPPLSEMASKRSTAEPSAIADEYLIAEVGHVG